MPTDSAIPQKFSITKARKAQTYLSEKVVSEDRLPEKLNFIAGVDVAYAGKSAIGAVVVLDYVTLELVESKKVTCQVRFPYVPTLLCFRETRAAIACIKRLNQQPDVFLVDGQGIAHPYRCGFASHLGLVIGKPTIGVAKSRLIGKPTFIGSDVFLVENSRIIGAVVTTKEKAKPVYVSIGHLVSLQTAIRIVKHCVRQNRIPEPLLQAHKIASKERRCLDHKLQCRKFNSL